ncbi:MAG TPA: hypothetical protein VGJ44_22065 [Kribbellaceae bacterium]
MTAELRLGVVEEGADADRLEGLSLQLRQELLGLDVSSVEPDLSGDAPEGTRGALAAVAGVLVVSLQPTLQTVGAVVAAVRDWMRRSGGNRTVKIEIGGDVLELTGASDQVQQRVVDDWIRRHAAS